MADDYQDESFASLEEDGSLNNETPIQNGHGGDPHPNVFDLKTLRVRSHLEFPLDLDVPAEIQNILAAGLFRNIENPIIYDKLCNMMLDERYSKLVEALFWVIFVIKFQKDDVELHGKLRKKLAQTYSEYFSLLIQPKEELSNMGIFGAAYVCHIMYFNLFAAERDHFDMRFILDCYHIVIHEVNGVFVSDFYVQSSIEKLFGSKFFHYEKRAEKKKKVEKKDFRDEPLLRDLNYDLQHLPHVPGGLDLAQELSNKLRKSPRKHKVGNTTGDFPESHSPQRGSVLHHHHKPIMRLTQQPAEEKSPSKKPEVEPYFPKLKFNCHQISPTVSSFLDNSTNTLPFQKKKVINLSSNKYMGGAPIDLHTYGDSGHDTKSDYKDKKKNIQKGSVSDYKLNNRPDDYYLGYMSPDMKKKFKMALDLKFIFDNVKNTLRGSNSVKGMIDEPPKKVYYSTPQTKNVSQDMIIQEEKEEEPRDNIKPSYTVEVDDGSRVEASLEKGEADKMERQYTFDKRLKSIDDGVNDLFLPAIKNTARTLSIGDGTPYIVREASMKKSIFPKLSEGMGTDRAKMERTHSVGPQEIKKDLVATALKFHTANNNKLGKGRFFVNLTDNNEDQNEEEREAKRKFAKKFQYEDRRKNYVSEHDALIRKDVDANIENLVDRLIKKQNAFSKSYRRPIGKKR